MDITPEAQELKLNRNLPVVHFCAQINCYKALSPGYRPSNYDFISDENDTVKCENCQGTVPLNYAYECVLTAGEGTACCELKVCGYCVENGLCKFVPVTLDWMADWRRRRESRRGW